MNVIILPEAENDLEEIADVISHDAPIRAVSFVRELRLSALALKDAPLAYALVPRYERRGIRRRIHGRYIIFYKIDGNQIFILRVVHGAREYIRLLDTDG